MTNTTHYNMTIGEGTDIVNPLTQIFPNFQTIDTAMFDNKQATIGTATEVTTGTVHAIVRNNTDSNVFRFTATSAWAAGDTMTLDGNAVTVHMTDGTTPSTGAYIIGAEVLAVVNASLVTLLISSNGGVTSFNSRTGAVDPAASDYDASMIDFDNTNTTLSSTDVQGAIEEVANGSIDPEVVATEQTTLTAARNYLSTDQFIYNGKLYRITASSVDAGDPLVIGTNCELANPLTNYKVAQYAFTNAKVSTSYQILCRKVGRLATVRFILRATDVIAINDILGTVGPDFYPMDDVYINTYLGDTLFLKTNGQLTNANLAQIAAGGYRHCEVTYITAK